MLIFNDRPPTESTPIHADDNTAFFREVASKLKPATGSAGYFPSILLVGGSDFASWTARSQQAPMRYDRRPSDYSHAALICGWDWAAPEQSWGLEVDPVRVPASQQVPEHAGVTPFRLLDYAETDAFPNLAVINVPLPAQGAEQVVEAARMPMRDALRFPLLRWLATWRAFITMPESMPHPLLNRLPHPGAALVAMAYEAAEVTLIPGATDLQHCPELLWANAKHWGHAVGDDVKVFRVLRDEDARVRTPRALPISLPETR
jgi:hypothetical protein